MAWGTWLAWLGSMKSGYWMGYPCWYEYLDSVLKSKDIPLLTKVHIVKAMVFLAVMYGFWELDHKEGRVPKNWCFWIMVLEKTFENVWIARGSNQSILMEINPEYSLERLMLKLKLQYFDCLMRRADFLEKTLMLAGWRQKRARGDEVVDWYHRWNGHELGQTPGDG